MNTRNFTWILVALTSFTFACNQSESNKQGSDEPIRIEKKEQVKSLQKAAEAPKFQPAKTGEPDSYGRLPGDAHYGHNHPPADQPDLKPTLQTSPAGAVPAAAPAGQPADGGPDKYGRMPGDAHYGHNHE